MKGGYQTALLIGSANKEGKMALKRGVLVMEKYYKVLGKNQICHHGGNGQWLPPPNWMPAIKGDLVACQNGYHILKREQVILWLGPEIWEVEVDGEIIKDTEKCLVRKARLTKQLKNWNERTARLFAADCAEFVLPLFEKKYPKDNRPRLAIQAARDFANGKIGDARDAARDAEAATWAAKAIWAAKATRAAAGAARAAAGAAEAARAAAGAAEAARAAAWAAAEAAGDTERKRQAEKLWVILEKGITRKN